MILAALVLAAPGPLDDVALDRKVDVWVRSATVAEAVAAVAKASERPLLAGGVFGDQLVNVFVRDVPARDVLKALADTLDAEWQASSAGPLLAIPSDRQSRLRSYIAAVDADLWARVEQSFGRIVGSERTGVKANRGEQDRATAGGRNTSSAAFVSEADNPAIRQLRELWPALRPNLRQFVSVRPTAKAEFQPESGTIRGTEVRRLGGPTLRALTLLRIAPTLEAIEVRYLADGVDGRNQFVPPQSADNEPLQKHPFREALKVWAATKPAAELEKPVTMALEGAQETWADAQIEAAAKDAEVNIVTDSYRVVAPKARGGTVGSVLGQMGWIRTEDSIVRLRFSEYWNRQRALPPENLLRRLERQPSVSLQDYRALLASLNPRARWLISREPLAVMFATGPLRSAPEVWFLGALTTAERRQLQAGPLPIANLSPASRRALDEALLEAAIQDLNREQVLALAVPGTASGTVSLGAAGDATITVGSVRITLANPL